MKDFGYPLKCTICQQCEICSEKNISLQVKPFYQTGNEFRLMLIGQDPAIFYRSERVEQVLMLNEENGQIKRWLKNLFEADNLAKFTIYATNIIKCTFPKPPSTYRGRNFLLPYFENCKKHLQKEVINFYPTLILTFGEPSHYYFTSLFDNADEIGTTMQSAFGAGKGFFKAKIKDVEFFYSPSLHIKTFRVAEVYGDRVKNFKEALKNIIKRANKQ